jgi:hypothetical protein
MSRRQHVVRTDDQAGLGTPRSVGGCHIHCASETPGPTLLAAAGTLAQGDEMHIAPITVTSTSDYQRCVVSASIDRVGAYLPDPPPDPDLNTFSVTFVPQDAVGEMKWISDPFDIELVGGQAYLESLHYQDIPYVSYSSQHAEVLIYSAAHEGYVNLVNVPSGSGDLDLGSMPIAQNLVYSQMAAFDTQVTVVMKSAAPGGFDLTIDTGESVPWESP